MTVAENQSHLVEEYRLIEDLHERLDAIVDRARPQPTWAEEQRREERLVRGCSSQVWLTGRQVADGTWRFEADCDSPLVRGLVMLVCRAFEDVRAADAATAEFTLLADLEVLPHLSSTRRHGLAAVRRRIAEIVRGEG